MGGGGLDCGSRKIDRSKGRMSGKRARTGGGWSVGRRRQLVDLRGLKLESGMEGDRVIEVRESERGKGELKLRKLGLHFGRKNKKITDSIVMLPPSLRPKLLI